MAKSKAKKLREKMSREGKRDPIENRSPFSMVDLRTRMTKTKKDHMYQLKHKNQVSNGGNDGSFFIQSSRGKKMIIFAPLTTSFWSKAVTKFSFPHT
ncbi:hypothetical protein LS684_11660 [Cytobacillus spongiae]|jgi:hypothetical protein|uniref:hypothetical protein n=1 Tax=Cytobacillus spongiae TaxID=2901381 RepID=UPI001F40C5BB|nr:hypothetical protein [Cytobacillus spongiae]UII54342.1 hypothetical protein LS684_11660 [Cytobacillus spongiae]